MTKAVLFDLDGTLADTAIDLGEALNRVLDDYALPRQPIKAIRPVASHGSRGLIQLGFGINLHDHYLPDLIEQFLGHYAQVYNHKTRLFAGIIPLLQILHARKLTWGIVTNKPSKFTDPLVAGLPFPTPPAVVVSGDTVGVAKPDPRPMQYALENIRCQGPEVIYLGDAERDIQAGRTVGMKTGIAAYGYIADIDRPEAWGADFSIHTPLDLLDYL
jgi:phosphoglycolate phosphatase